jgi:hypothetical protein
MKRSEGKKRRIKLGKKAVRTLTPEQLEDARGGGGDTAGCIGNENPTGAFCIQHTQNHNQRLRRR